MVPMSRRSFTAAASALPLVSLGGRFAQAAEFSYKLATNLPAAHPLSARNAEAAARVKDASNGRLVITTFPSSQLGSDTDMLSQLRSGALEFFTLSPIILSTFVPLTSISGIGFAFKTNEQALAAMDGDLGAFVRGEIAKKGLLAFDRMFNSGFRQITSSSKPIKVPDDLQGMKIRVPPSALWTSMFRDFGAGPTSINFSEVYSALQTKIVDGQENPLPIIDSAKLYEVQKYCSMTSHMWDGYWLLANQKAWKRLPNDLQEITQKEFAQAAMDQRQDIAKLNEELRGSLSDKGLQFNDVDRPAFRDVLAKAGFYTEWKEKYGDKAWQLLEASAGQLS